MSASDVTPPPVDVLAYAVAYSCPDCVPDKGLSLDSSGLWRLHVWHADTCPLLAHIEGRRRP